MTYPLIDAFRMADAKGLPDIHCLDSDLDLALWVLEIAKRVLDPPYLTAAQIAHVVARVYGVARSRQKIQAELRKAGDLVHRRRVKGITSFAIMKKGEEVLHAYASPASVLLIESHTAFSGIRQVQDILDSLRGTLSICDPYIDNRTLDFLAEASSASHIRLLTMKVQKPSRLRRDYAAYHSQYGNLEIRVASSPTLHDRYIISDDSMFLLGQSLNGLGRKQSFIVRVGEDIRQETLAAFQRRWNAATPFA